MKPIKPAIPFLEGTELQKRDNFIVCPDCRGFKMRIEIIAGDGVAIDCEKCDGIGYVEEENGHQT